MEKIINIDNTNKYLFPVEKDIEYNKLQITKEGLFSITHPKYSELITKYIKESLYNEKKNLEDLVITDATSNVGGNVLNFSKYFKSVNAIELDKLTCDVLKNNINVYNRKNINVYCGDSTNILKDLNQDIIFFDPPWGGKKYMKSGYIILKLSNIKISEIINQYINNVILIVMKVPININISELIRNINFCKIEFYKIRNYGLITFKKLCLYHI
jgi:16S rRNA G966 N2-methylase RsmD